MSSPDKPPVPIRPGLVTVTRDLAPRLPFEYGMRLPGGHERFIPIELVFPEDDQYHLGVGIDTLREDGRFMTLETAGFLPSASPYESTDANDPPYMITLLDRTRSLPLNRMHLLSLDRPRESFRLPFRYGVHPNGPPHPRFYFTARRIGSIGLDYRGRQTLKGAELAEVEDFMVVPGGSAYRGPYRL